MTTEDDAHRFFQVAGQAGGGDTRQAVIRGSYYFGDGNANTGLISEFGAPEIGLQNNDPMPIGLYDPN